MRNIMAWLIAPVGMAATMLLDDWISGPIDSSLRGAIALVVVTKPVPAYGCEDSEIAALTMEGA